MTMPKLTGSLALILVGAAMSALLAGSVLSRAVAVASAPEVVMDAAGYDPRAPLLGHFAQVRLAAADTWTLGEADAAALSRTHRVWATLAPGERDGDWRLVGVSPRRPTPAAGQIAARVRVANVTDGAVRIDYGIDRLYLPQHQAEAVQDAAMRRGADGEVRLQLVLARLGDGTLAVKGAIVAGERIDVPLL